MTAQVFDTIIYHGQPYSLVARTGGRLFDPTEHDLHPVAVSTANWAGHICTYQVTDDRLYLESVTMGLGHDERLAIQRGEGIELFGVAPVLAEGGYQAWYEGLHHALPYSGVLTLAIDFIPELYVHMGFHPPWKFRTVIDLMFKAGRLIQETDRSADMAQMRAAMTGQGPQPPSIADEDDR